MDTSVKRIQVDGASLAFIDVGEGVPLVFVHGAITDHRFWEPQFGELGTRFRCIALTQRYFGPDSWSDDGSKYSRTTHTSDLIAFLEALEAGPVHLVGLSYGGEIALAAAVERPGLIRSLFLHEPSLTSVVETPDDLAALAEERKALGPAIAALKCGDVQQATQLFVEWTADQVGGFTHIPRSLQVVFLDNARTLGPHLKAIPSAVTGSDLGRLNLPVTLSTGGLTRPLFQVFVRAVHRCISQSRVVVIPNAHHGASFENTTSFNLALVNHVEHCPSAAA